MASGGEDSVTSAGGDSQEVTFFSSNSSVSKRPGREESVTDTAGYLVKYLDTKKAKLAGLLTTMKNGIEGGSKDLSSASFTQNGKKAKMMIEHEFIEIERSLKERAELFNRFFEVEKGYYEELGKRNVGAAHDDLDTDSPDTDRC